jgi:radical SAM superfamily enzyme YgiQ (UPF0313 family)
MKIQTAFLIRVSSEVDKVDHPQFFDPSYQLKYFQAELEQNRQVEVQVHDCWIHPMPTAGLLEEAREARPDLVVISASSFDLDVANALARGIQDWEKAPVVIGIGQGMYLNRDWEDGHPEFYDAILLGEPEVAFQGLLDSLIGGEESWQEKYRELFKEGKRFMVQDLDALPFPTYTKEELESYRSIYPVRLAKRVIWGFLIAGRGCPYACTFCSEVMRVSIGTKMRVRSGKNVVDEMEHLMGEGCNIISFQDDSFSSSKIQVEDVCDELIRRKVGISWMARVRVDEVDYELLKLMKEAGCVLLGIGAEAGSQRIIDRVRKTYKPKPWADLCRQTFGWTRELCIGTNAYYVLGNPSETREELESTVKLAMELNADSIQVHFHTPYPGSADWETFRREYPDVDPTSLFHYADPTFSMSEVDPKELVEIRSRFYKRYIMRPSFVLRHMWHYWRFYLKNRDIFWTLLGIRKIIKGGHKEETQSPAPVLEIHDQREKEPLVQQKETQAPSEHRKISS